MKLFLNTFLFQMDAGHLQWNNKEGCPMKVQMHCSFSSSLSGPKTNVFINVDISSLFIIRGLMPAAINLHKMRTNHIKPFCTTLVLLTKVKNLGMILETDLSFSSHVKAVTKSAYYHLKNIARIRCFVPVKTWRNLFMPLSQAGW